MAFVFRNQRKHEHQAQNVGPGSYNFDIPRQTRIPKAYVPFGSMEPKSKQPQSAGIGPGSYNLDLQRSGQKIIVSSETEDIKILQISRPNPVFKSAVKRFSELKQDHLSPGPGQYNIQPMLRPKMFSTNTTSKPKILQHLISINQYQSIPSIPSNIHAYGYNENESNQLELNEPPIQCFKGEKSDMVGPGHYNAEKINKPRGLSWKKSAEQSLPVNSVVGPGSYEVAAVNPLYNYKPSSGFASKTLRTMDVKDKSKSVYTKPIEAIDQVASSQASSRLFSEKAAPSTHIDSDEDEYEYIEDTTPGPGSYLEISQIKKIKPLSSFGKSKRFQGKPTLKQIGPGSYEVEAKAKLKAVKQRKKNALPVDRCPSLINKLNTDLPGPGAYQPRNTMEDKLIYKIQRGYRGQFGSMEPRGKQSQDEQLPGPGSYEPHSASSEKEIASSFKSKVERRFIEQTGNPAPGSYNLIYTDIATKVIKEQEDDPDLIVEKPGFGVAEQRFKEIERPTQQFEDEDIIKEIQEKHREERKLKMLKNNAVFKSADARFKGVQKEIPGPGAYHDGEEDYWNKRTYNILFADI